MRPALALSGAALLLGLGCSEPVVEGPPPNVLLLVIDCLRADRLGADGYGRPASPNLTALAKESVQFTHVFAQTNWTRPSIPSYLTGLYPSEHGLRRLQQGEEASTSEGLSSSAVTLAEALATRGYSRAMIGEQHQLAPRFGLNQGFEHYNHKGFKAARIHEGLLDWLGEASAPFFAYLHYLELHWPYCPPEETRGRFTAGYEGRSFCFQWRKLRDDLRSGAVILEEDEIEAMAGRYDEELLALDAEIGELFADLKERGLWEETLVVVTSDHGEEFFEHGGMGHGSSLHDELIAVPLLFKPPASWEAPVGSRVDGLVELRDLAATLMDVAGVDPDDSAGISLLPAIRGRRGDPGRSYVTSEDSRSVSIRTRDLKLIAHREGGVELYDLAVDPLELEPLDLDSRRRDVARLQGYLRDWRGGLEPLETRKTVLDEETVEGLRSLGYVE